MIMHTTNNTTNAKLISSGLESDVYCVRDHNGSGSELILKKSKPTSRQNYLFEAYAYHSLKSFGRLYQL